MVLLEEGVEMELPASLSQALGILDEVVPTFSCRHFGYQVGSVNRARLGSSWGLWVKLVNRQSNEVLSDPVGCIELEKIDDNKVNFRVPARSEQDFPGMSKFDHEGELYGSFIYQMLNLLHQRKLIELPGMLPTF
jgi:hypothetical protein